MATEMIAQQTGMYECSGIGQTVYAKKGEKLPAHDTCEGGCEWRLKPDDESQSGKLPK